MDPQACLVEMLNHVRAGEADDARERLDDLLDWCRKGGFMPDLARALAEVDSA